jgi:hypothetical protein
MRFRDFRAVIANLPTPYQSATSEREKWEPWISQDDAVGIAIRSIFSDFGKEDGKQASISRSDLGRLGREPQLDRFVMATILWGYETPAGMRGDNFSNFTSHLSTLTKLLHCARSKPIPDWDSHFAKVTPISGIGLSTYTKFLTFLSAKVHGYPALILDDQIVQVLQRGHEVFVELNPLRVINDSNKHRVYPQYLGCIHQIATELSVTENNIELFLYKFGSDLKDIKQNIRLRAYEFYERRGRVDGQDVDDWLRAELEIWGLHVP